MSTNRISLIIGITLTVSAVGLVAFLAYKTGGTRPQDPSTPYPYYTERVVFKNVEANITLAGTLTLPSAEGTFPAVILISGSGPQNRDEEILRHRPFLVIADHLTKSGIAVLRYDDRGVGKSTADFKAATTVDFASDAASAVEYLKTRKEIDGQNIGLIGHSEGGLVAPMVASSSNDVSFIVLLAGPGIELRKVLMLQQELIPRAMGASEGAIRKSITMTEEALQMILTSTDRETLKAALAKLIEKDYDSISAIQMFPKLTKEQYVGMQSDNLSSQWFKHLLSYDPALTLEKVSCPVLAINGEKDIQVTAKENLAAISGALAKGGNVNVTVKELPNLNHFFQNCKTGSPTEYESIEETFSPVALKEVSDWVLKQVR